MPNEEKIWSFLRQAGMTSSGAAGMMGNIQAESAFIPNNLQDSFERRLGFTNESYTKAVDDGSYGKFVPDGSGYGICQWTFWTRKQGLLDLARYKHVSIGDLDMQLEYMISELKSNYPTVWHTLTTTDSVSEASWEILRDYEMPDDAEGKRQTREAYSWRWFEEFGITNTEDKGVLKLSNCSHDENGRYSGGNAGDQTGAEWRICDWYKRPWNAMYRHPDVKVQETLNLLAVEAANNNKIGYDQSQRTSFWNQLKVSGYRPSKITKKCEADCSSGVSAIIKATGYLIGDKKLQDFSPDNWTGSLNDALTSAGFVCYTGTRYLANTKKLKPGDILLNYMHHVAIVVDPENVKELFASEPEKDEPKEMYRIIAASSKTKKGATALASKLACDTFVYKSANGWWAVQAGAFTKKANADKRLKEVQKTYPDAYITGS